MRAGEKLLVRALYNTGREDVLKFMKKEQCHRKTSEKGQTKGKIT